MSRVTVSVVTPTCDRPAGIALLERWMARQTVTPDEWIVADGGATPARLTMGQRHLHERRPRGAMNFGMNVRRGVEAATGEVVVIFEDDDWYAPTHLAQMLTQLARPGIQAAGDDQQRYYNLPQQRWKVMQNKGASLCQTAFRREALPLMRTAVTRCVTTRSFGIDAAFWRRVPREAQSLERTETVVGIKGLPGSLGLGVGHTLRFMRGGTSDPEWRQLRRWVADDADVYRAVMAGEVAA